ncbi:uncharacterized protein LOC124369680 [Homalodisca vitripennis]|uniref:uncharacterized protein LOC124369680 n=1 Tax=Homalodisca vitripennis TaxID=197043 RepID=UPI001EEBDDEB|nr:uncharacterized protein LOC124369680 [Homalodisca vitripennis]
MLKVLQELKFDVLEELKTFKLEMSSLFDTVKTFRKDMDEVAASVKFASNKLDEANKLMREMSAEFVTLRKENEELRSRNANLACEVTALKDKVRSIDQYSRKDNLEISGLPVTPNEDTNSLVKDLAQALGVEVSESDISTSHRVPAFQKNRTPALIVKFVRRSTRDSIIEKYRQRNGGLTARDVSAVFPGDRVFVNEHLAPDNKVFLSKLKAKCREVVCVYAWARDGKFFVRKSQGAPFKRVESYEALESLT